MAEQPHPAVLALRRSCASLLWRCRSWWEHSLCRLHILAVLLQPTSGERVAPTSRDRCSRIHDLKVVARHTVDHHRMSCTVAVPYNTSASKEVHCGLWTNWIKGISSYQRLLGTVHDNCPSSHQWGFCRAFIGQLPPSQMHRTIAPTTLTGVAEAIPTTSSSGLERTVVTRSTPAFGAILTAVPIHGRTQLGMWIASNPG